MINKNLIEKSQMEWGNGIIEIGKLKQNRLKCEEYTKSFLYRMYDFNNSKEILFKPTKAKIIQFRSSFEKALEMEQHVYQSLLHVHQISEQCNDPQFSDFIESEYLEEQISSINELSGYISQLNRIGENGFGIWSFNNEFNNDVSANTN